MPTLRTSAGIVIVGILAFWVLDTLGRSRFLGEFLIEWLFSGEVKEQFRNGRRLSFVRGIVVQGGLIAFFITLLRYPDLDSLLKRLKMPAFIAGCAVMAHWLVRRLLMPSLVDAEGTTATYEWLNLIVGTLVVAAMLTFFATVFVRSAREGDPPGENAVTTGLRLAVWFAAAATTGVLVIECLPLVAKFSPRWTVEDDVRVLRDFAMTAFFFVVFAREHVPQASRLH